MPLSPRSGSAAHPLLRAVGTISFFTLVSRIFGFVRDVVIARGFGSGMGADAFFVAFKLPNFLRRLFAEGAMSTAFVPVFSDSLARGNVEETREVVHTVFTALTAALMILVVLAELGMPWLILVTAPGFSDQPEKMQLAIDLTRITFPYILLISLVSLAGGILNSHKRFAIPAATPVLLNVFLILGALLLSPLLEEPVMGLAWGVLAGGVAQLALQLPALSRIGMSFRLRWDPRHPALRRILKLMGPSILGVSAVQINLLFDIFLASWLPEGSISYLYYADRLVEFPLGLIGIAMGTAILPALSAKAAVGDLKGMGTDLSFALRMVLFINLPATVGLLVLREPILALLFQRGAFDAAATDLTSRALFAYGLGLLAFSGIKVLAPAYYSMQDTRTPVRFGLISVAVNMACNVILMFPLQHVGLALATTIAAYVNAFLLLVHLQRKVGFRPGRELWVTALKTLAACLAMGATLHYGGELYLTGDLGTWARALRLLAVIAVGCGVFFVTARLLGCREMGELRAAFSRR
ncbi:MAG: murein biosynthesis integral membrane protein MurJ [Magnetococcales bacterium]|nr:murein biosynthesis integral membrane protein MurJ [Magnetococcales bacterium]